MAIIARARRQARHLHGGHLRADHRAPAAVRPADGDGLFLRRAHGRRALGQKRSPTASCTSSCRSASAIAASRRSRRRTSAPGSRTEASHESDRSVPGRARAACASRLPKSQAHRLLICAALGAQPVACGATVSRPTSPPRCAACAPSARTSRTTARARFASSPLPGKCPSTPTFSAVRAARHCAFCCRSRGARRRRDLSHGGAACRSARCRHSTRCSRRTA